MGILVSPTTTGTRASPGWSFLARAPRPAVAVWLVLAALPVAFTVWFVEGFSLVVPLLDQWELLAFYEKLAAGEAGLLDFLAPQNRMHVILVPRILLSTLAFLTHLNFRTEAYLGLALVLLTAAALNRALRHSLGETASPRTLAVVNLFTVCLLFAPVQEHIWTWTLGFLNFLENACLAGAVWALARPRPRVTAAFLFCAVASFNRLEGLLSWFVFLPAVLAAAGSREERTRTLLGWGAGALLCWTLCAFVVLSQPGDVVPALGGSPVSRLLFTSGLIGISTAWFTESWLPRLPPTHAAFPAGALIIAAYLFLSVRLWRSRESRTAATPWIALGAFGLVFALSASLARSWITGTGTPGGLAQFMTWYYLSEFSPTSALVSISSMHLLVRFCAGRDRICGLSRQGFGQLATATGLLVVVLNYVHAAPRLLERRLDGHWSRYCVELMTYMDPVANTCWIDPETAGVFERTGLRRVRRDVDFGKPLGAEGTVLHTRTVEGTSLEEAKVVVTGWVSLPDEDAGTVLLAFEDSSRFFAQATRLDSRGAGMRWSATIPAAVGSGGKVVHAWAYDKKRGLFWRLDGKAVL